jgi:hypothetical protein
MILVLLTFIVSSNGYHKAFARGDLDALGTKIRESVNNQITEELSGSTGPDSGSSPPSSFPSQIPTILSLTVASLGDQILCKLSGTLKTDTGSALVGATISFTTSPSRPQPTVVTDGAGDYSIVRDCVNFKTYTAHYSGAPPLALRPIPEHLLSASEETKSVPPL